mgnify:CR=1 FL=1
MALIFALPFLVWRLGRTEYFAPLVVVQIVTGIVLGPGILGAAFPEYYRFVFNPAVVQSLNGIAWWAVMCFVLLAGIELDLKHAWEHRRESSTAAGLALGVPLLTGSVAAAVLALFPGWIGPRAHTWQFIVGVGMACAVTALPILVLFLEKLGVLRTALGQRILRYASMDDIAIWGVLALILMDWNRVGRQAGFLVAFVVVAFAFRQLMQRLGYAGYVAQGGDWGSIVTSSIAQTETAHCRGVHLNMPIVAPDMDTMHELSELEQSALAGMHHYNEHDSGYSKQQSTRPQTLGYGLADSPSGQAAWILEKFWAWTDCGDGEHRHPESVLSRDELLDNVMMYWLTNSSASSARLYWESFRTPNIEPVTIPVGASIFPKEIFRR